MKFTIRDLFLVTLVVAVCVAWWVDHRRQGAEIDRLKPKAIDFAFPTYSGMPTSQTPVPNPPKQ